MKCCVMQPTYLPWAGYFNLIARADHFVFLDDVQFEKGSWQNRNRVLLEGKPHWITVPALREHLSQTIREIRIDDRNRWRDKQLKLLVQAYAKAPYWGEVYEVLKPILSDLSHQYLEALNISLIRGFSSALGIETPFYYSSKLGVQGNRTARLVRICQSLNCLEYLSPEGSRNYITQDGDFENSGIEVRYQTYEPAPYQQFKTGTFVSRLSIVDVWAHLGREETRAYISQELPTTTPGGNHNASK